MGGLSVERMQAIQRELQERYRNKWEPIGPETGKNKLLWMMIEAGEMADIIKKDGDGRIMDNPEVRTHFIEELCDTMMYLHDIMLCYSITPEELEQVYLQKHARNMKRW